jgi:predicted nucleotidyltransferase
VVDRLELAKQYLQELLKKREDIVGAFVAGSVARGDADETSDVDLIVVVECDDEKGQHGRETVGVWRAGVYVDVEVRPIIGYSSAERVLRDSIRAGEICEALILHDPVGHLAQVQRDVQVSFREPRFVEARVRQKMLGLRESLSVLRTAVAERDLLGVCIGEAQVANLLVTIPPTIVADTVSSSTGLVRLAARSPDLAVRVSRWEGSAAMDSYDVLALLPTINACLPVTKAAGFALEFDVRRAELFARTAHHEQAVHLMWRVIAYHSHVIRASSDAALASHGTQRVQDWFHAVGWEGQDVLEQKVRMAEEMVAEMEAMAADLPSPGG